MQDKQDRTPAFLAVTATIAVFIVLIMLWVRPVPPESKDQFTMLSAGILSVWTGITGFYFGSSKATQHQAELLSRSTLNPTPTSGATITTIQKEEITKNESI